MNIKEQTSPQSTETKKEIEYRPSFSDLPPIKDYTPSLSFIFVGFNLMREKATNGTK